MIYKNSVKLLTSNFSLVWKQLAYTLLRIAFVVGLTMLVSMPMLEVLKNEGFVQSLATMWESVYTNAASFLPASQETIELFFAIICRNMSSLWGSIILFFLVTVVINSFLRSVGKYTLTYVAHSNFTSLNNCGYSQSLLCNFKDICIYSLCRLALDIPFAIIKAVFVIVYCLVLNNWIMAIIGISLLIILYTLIYALQISLYNNFAVAQITTKRNPFKTIFKGYKSKKDFFKVFSNAIVIVLTIIVLNVVLGVFTVGAGLIISIPISMALVVIFELVSYYTTNKQRYYLSPTIIVDTQMTGEIEKIQNNT